MLRTTRTYILSGMLLMLSATNGNATGSINCSGMSDEVSVRIVLGAGPIPNIAQAEIRWDGRVISTFDSNDPAIVARSYIDVENIKLDIMDDQATEQVASIRVVRSLDADTEGLQVGFVKLVTLPPMMIMCDGP